MLFLYCQQSASPLTGLGRPVRAAQTTYATTRLAPGDAGCRVSGRYAMSRYVLALSIGILVFCTTGVMADPVAPSESLALQLSQSTYVEELTSIAVDMTRRAIDRHVALEDFEHSVQREKRARARPASWVLRGGNPGTIRSLELPTGGPLRRVSRPGGNGSGS
jgi:hypothetical protein